MRRPDPTHQAHPLEWAAFLDRAIGGLRLAARELRANRADFERKTDWFRTARKYRGVPRENSVSAALKQLFDELRADQAISGSGVQAVDLRGISVECERPRPLDPGIADEAKPTDFSLVLLTDGALDLRVEAKTLLDDKDLKQGYLGVAGLCRFEDAGNPYTTRPFGGMMAYVVTDDAERWNAAIGQALAIRMGDARFGSRMVAGCPHHVSHHRVVPLAAGFPAYEVEVVHLVVEIDALPSRR